MQREQRRKLFFGNKNGELAKEALLMLVTVVLTSALVFSLLHFGILKVDGSATHQDILNTEFLPFDRGGELAVKNFRFCNEVSSELGCMSVQESFILGEEVHFFFEVMSTVYNGDLLLVENYELVAPDGRVILAIDEKNDFYFETTSSSSREIVYFDDYFVLGASEDPGIYTLNVVIKNPIIDKQIVLSEQFSAVG